MTLNSYPYMYTMFFEGVISHGIVAHVKPMLHVCCVNHASVNLTMRDMKSSSTGLRLVDVVIVVM